MNLGIDFVGATSAIAQRYITLKSVDPKRTYNYKARGFSNLPVVQHEIHAPKCAQGESWTYYVLPVGVKPNEAGEEHRLYVGAQTQDRMFRGDGLKGNNYHHAEMRAGKNGNNLVSYIRAHGSVVIYRVNAAKVVALINSNTGLSSLELLLQQPISSKKHMGWWLEQYMLYSQPNIWQWNSDPAGKDICSVFQVATM